MARGGTQGGLNCLTHALPRRLPTPNSMEADGNGYGVITGRAGGSLGPPPRVSVNLVHTCTWTTAVDRRSDKTRQEHLPMLRRLGLPGFPDHLIITLSLIAFEIELRRDNAKREAASPR